MVKWKNEQGSFRIFLSYSQLKNPNGKENIGVHDH